MSTACDNVDSLLAKNGFATRPSARRRVIVDKVSQSRGLPGYQVTVDTTALSGYLKDALGRTAHIIGIRLETAVVVTPTATVPVTPQTGHALRGCIYNVKLQGQDGHQYLRDLDARAMIFDSWAREGAIVNSPPLGPDYNPDVANPFTKRALMYPTPNAERSVFGMNPTDNYVDGVVVVRDISLDYPLISGEAMAGILPLAEVLNNNGQFLFTLRDRLAYGPDGWPVTRYECIGETQTAVRVIFDLLYIDAVVTSRRWLVDDYTLTVVDGPFKYPGFLHTYIAARWREEDIRQGGASLTNPYGALINPNSITNLMVTLGGVSEVQGLTATQLLSRLKMILEAYPGGEINTWDRQSALPALLGITDGALNTGVDYLGRCTDFFVPFAPRPENRSSGPVSYSMDAASMPANGLLRVIHRVEGELSDAPIRAAAACGCKIAQPTPTVITDKRGNQLLTTAKQLNLGSPNRRR